MADKKANEARAKAERYGNEAKAYKAFADTSPGGKGPLGLDYTAGKDAKNAVANMYESEAEALDKRAEGKKKGGVISASKRADGIATKGKTRGTMIMCGGGKVKK